MSNNNFKQTDTWLTPKKAIEELQKRNNLSMIGEKTLRNLIKQGFPCISVGNRKYINIDTFNDDVKSFSKKPCDISVYTNKKKTNKNNSVKNRRYDYNNGAIRKIEI